MNPMLLRALVKGAAALIAVATAKKLAEKSYEDYENFNYSKGNDANGKT